MKNLFKKEKHWFVVYSEKERGRKFAEQRSLVRAYDAWEAYSIAEIDAKKKEGDWIVIDMKPLD